MDWKQTETYFQNIQSPLLVELFKDCEYPWQALNDLEKSIVGYFDELSDLGSLPANRNVIHKADGSFMEGAYALTDSILLDSDFIDTELKIFIGAGTLIEAGATIKNNIIVEPNSEIRQGAYMRGNVYIGAGSVVGHTTEIKNSIFIKHVEAGHFAYIGDSILGSYVNIGAGTKISNLQFRTLEEKQTDQFPQIPLTVGGVDIDTGRAKFGALVGDGGETGCNSVLSPFSLLARECWVVPCLSVLKGAYPPETVLTSVTSCKKHKI